MKRSPSDSTTERGEPNGIDRRDVLKMIGVGAGTVQFVSGTASAHRNTFYGCSQVCSDSKGNEAVVAVDGKYECREMNTTSDRKNDWSYDSHCYEAADGESIVGVVVECDFCVNPNTCASNYYDSVDDVIEDIEGACSTCTEIGTDGECDVSGTGGGRGNGKKDSGKRRGKGKKGKGHGNGNGNRGNR